MKLLQITGLLASGALAATRPNIGGQKVIMENDWSTTAAGQFLMALDYGWDVLGLVGDTANTWALQSSLHALALLEVGNLSCIPVYKGADYPLLVTPKIMTAYQNLMGPFPWKGVFAEYNETAESLGSEATGGVPHSSPAALYEGYPNTTVAGNYSAAWMIEQVHTYPGEIVFYSGGALTNLALAVRMDPEFAALTKGLYIMGGFADNNLLMTSGDLDQADINTDFNFKADPEATKIVLTAAFPNITLVSNAANAYFADTAYLEEAYEIQTPYTKLARDYSETYLPLWDEITTMVMLDPSAILNQTSFYVNVDTSFYSPTYGNIWAYQDILKPSLQDLREVNFVYSTNETMLRTTLKRALQYPKSCS